MARRGVLRIFDQRGCAVFQDFVFTLFLTPSIERRQSFGAGCQRCSVRAGCYFKVARFNFWVLEYTFHQLFVESDILGGKSYGVGSKLFWWEYPSANGSQVPFTEASGPKFCCLVLPSLHFHVSCTSCISVCILFFPLFTGYLDHMIRPWKSGIRFLGRVSKLWEGIKVAHCTESLHSAIKIY